MNDSFTREMHYQREMMRNPGVGTIRIRSEPDEMDNVHCSLVQARARPFSSPDVRFLKIHTLLQLSSLRFLES